MTTSSIVAPAVRLVKGPARTEIRPAQALRESFKAHGVTESVLSKAWNVTARVASRYLRGERAITVERLEGLPDAVLADFARRILGRLSARPTRDIQAELTDVMVQLGRLADEVRAALANGEIDPTEAARIKDEVAKTMRELADVDVAAARCG